MDYLSEIRYLYILKNIEVNSDIYFKNNYFDSKKRRLS